MLPAIGPTFVRYFCRIQQAARYNPIFEDYTCSHRAAYINAALVETASFVNNSSHQRLDSCFDLKSLLAVTQDIANAASHSVTKATSVADEQASPALGECQCARWKLPLV